MISLLDLEVIKICHHIRLQSYLCIIMINFLISSSVETSWAMGGFANLKILSYQKSTGDSLSTQYQQYGVSIHSFLLFSLLAHKIGLLNFSFHFISNRPKIN